MFEIMEVSSVLVPVNVENEFYHSINDGDKVTATVEVLPGRTFPAVVYKKGPVADPKSKTFPVDVKIENDDNAIKPGWYAEVVFPAKAASKRK
jgi:cobalt-zinc-cadmium efflux system membrane fusion protein